MNDEFEQIVSGLGESQETYIWADALREAISKSAVLLNEIFHHLVDIGLPRESAIHIVNGIWDMLSAKEA